jgi:hypothetical protein
MMGVETKGTGSLVVAVPVVATIASDAGNAMQSRARAGEQMTALGGKLFLAPLWSSWKCPVPRRRL